MKITYAGKAKELNSAERAMVENRVTAFLQGRGITQDLSIKVKGNAKKILVKTALTQNKDTFYKLKHKNDKDKSPKFKGMQKDSDTYKQLKSVCEEIKAMWKEAVKR